ncbi:MAG TPA: polyprenyl diphosphate synthase [Bryobacteraceae bacterium]|nr:polyprenyl diphosphate synthase [Bryobacteraceae bacterium]
MKQSSLHVAIIMDGNGRWAAARGLPRFEGHRAGAEALRRIVEAAPRLNIGVLTVYAFSADNWKRPPEEVDALMLLLACYFEREAPRMRDAGVRVSVIGRRDRLPDPLLRAIEHAESTTRHCTCLEFRLAVDYSARAAIVEAARRGALEESIPVDLLIRTGGEQRLSDFLLWESAYAELIFTRRMWPDFTPAALRSAVGEFHHRDRRFGAVSESLLAAPPPQPVAERWLR